MVERRWDFDFWLWYLILFIQIILKYYTRSDSLQIIKCLLCTYVIILQAITEQWKVQIHPLPIFNFVQCYVYNGIFTCDRFDLESQRNVNTNLIKYIQYVNCQTANPSSIMLLWDSHKHMGNFFFYGWIFVYSIFTNKQSNWSTANRDWTV